MPREKGERSHRSGTHCLSRETPSLAGGCDLQSQKYSPSSLAERLLTQLCRITELEGHSGLSRPSQCLGSDREVLQAAQPLRGGAIMT